MARDGARKIEAYRGFVIAETYSEWLGDTEFQVFTPDEWSMGEGYRYPEFDNCGSVKECRANIDCYGE